METTRPTLALTAQAAMKAVAAAVAKGNSLGVAVNACIVDAGANQIAFLRDDGAFLPSGAIALDKARTAVGFGTSTAVLHEKLSAEPTVLAGIMARPGIVLFGGGLPVRKNGELIGGIGVSGASAEQDEICAMAGITALELTQD